MANADDNTQPTRIAVLGSTGSIGTQTLRVVEHLNQQSREYGNEECYEIVGLAAQSNGALLVEQAQKHAGVRSLAVADSSAVIDGFRGEVYRGQDAASELIEETEPDLVIASIVGVAGLQSTLTALEMGIDVALANKETLVAAGPLVTATAERTGARLLPVDSEHAGVWQALQPSERGFEKPPFTCNRDVARVTITASGGALRTWPVERLARATVQEALAHPNWDMGAKVTIDTASMANKALELMEAAHLFGLELDRLDAVVHPQSIVHAVVAFADGSSIAQMAVPDMCAPIQYALTAPERPRGVTRHLSLTESARLDFIEMDPDRYPCFFLGRRAIEEGGSAGAVFNAANEEAVGAFLAGSATFGDISMLIERAMDAVPTRRISTLDDVMNADAAARDSVRTSLETSTRS